MQLKWVKHNQNRNRLFIKATKNILNNKHLDDAVVWSFQTSCITVGAFSSLCNDQNVLLANINKQRMALWLPAQAADLVGKTKGLIPPGTWA